MSLLEGVTLYCSQSLLEAEVRLTYLSDFVAVAAAFEKEKVFVT